MTKVFVAEFDSVVAIARILAPLCAADYARPDGCFRIPDPIAGYAGGDVGFMWPRDRILAFPASVASHYVTPPADTELH